MRTHADFVLISPDKHDACLRTYMDVEGIVKLFVIIASMLGALRRVRRLITVAIKNHIDSKVSAINAQLSNMGESITEMKNKLHHMESRLETIGTHSIGSKVALVEMAKEIQISLKANTDAIRQLEKSSAEWVDDNTVVIHGAKPKG